MDKRGGGDHGWQLLVELEREYSRASQIYTLNDLEQGKRCTFCCVLLPRTFLSLALDGFATLPEVEHILFVYSYSYPNTKVLAAGARSEFRGLVGVESAVRGAAAVVNFNVSFNGQPRRAQEHFIGKRNNKK